MLTPVENPTAYGLVETDATATSSGSSRSRSPDEITTNTINAGIYVLEPDTFDRIPRDVSWSIERSYFPSLIERGETFVAYVYDGYWIDIGTPEKYTRCTATSWTAASCRRPFKAGRRRARRSRRMRGSRTARPSRGRASSTRASRQGGRPHRPLLGDRPSDPGRRKTRSSTAPSSGPTAASARTRRHRNAIVGRNCHVGRNVAWRVRGRCHFGRRSTTAPSRSGP